MRRTSAAPLLTVAAEVLGRDGKVRVRRLAARRGRARVKAGTFSVPVTLPRVGRGTRVRVVATLADEARDNVSVRKTVATRAK